jgi:hypothetical protein
MDALFSARPNTLVSILPAGQFLARDYGAVEEI